MVCPVLVGGIYIILENIFIPRIRNSAVFFFIFFVLLICHFLCCNFFYLFTFLFFAFVLKLKILSYMGIPQWIFNWYKNLASREPNWAEESAINCVVVLSYGDLYSTINSSCFLVYITVLFSRFSCEFPIRVTWNMYYENFLDIYGGHFAWSFIEERL